MNEKLKRVLRVLKHRGLDQSTPAAELAELSGLSRQTIIKSKQEREEYLKSAPLPSTADEKSVDRKLISTYVDIALTSGNDKGHFTQITGAVAGFVLRSQSNLINNIQSPKKIVRVGQEYLSVMTRVEARKGNKGTPIHSQDRSAKYLLTELNNSTLVSELFSRSNSYSTGAYSKLWKLTPKADELNKLIMDETIRLIEEDIKDHNGFTHTQLHIEGGICSGKSVNQDGSDVLSVEERDVEIPLDKLGTLSVRSFLQVMEHAQPLSPRSLCVPLRNLANVDPAKGRTYNIFTRLKSEERKSLGYRNYDISGGLQMICFNILYLYPHSKYEDFFDLQAAYPLIFEYGYDPEAKQALREEIAADLGKSIEEVKQLLTAYANGSQQQVGNSPKLQEFFDQSDQLRREVIAVIDHHEHQILEAAIEQSTKAFPEDMDWQSAEEETSDEARDKASVFFFIWTHFEKQIRDAMLSVVDDGIPVHDAIYSKHDIDFKVFEEAIRNQTGFDVKIGN